MSAASRVLWIVVVLSLVAGGIAITAASRARADAADELVSVSKRLGALEEEARVQPGRISELTEDRKDRVALARECLLVIAIQGRALSRLLKGPAGNITRADLDQYADDARDLLLGFRQLLDDCEGT
jgi:hypothetical protein